MLNHFSESLITAQATQYRKRGRGALSPFLDPDFAQTLLESIETWPHWNLVTRLQGQHRDFDAAGMQALSPERSAPFMELVHQGAGEGFQYLFENFPLYEEGRAGRLSGPLKDIYMSVRSEPFLALMRQITGHHDISYADCQLTRFRPGHYLTLHNDGIEDKNRRTAFVINLSAHWRVDYGGLLQFITPQGDVAEALTPDFNRLCYFNVPQDHSVSCVAPFAPHPRYAITGWLRYGVES
ncbi:2OG-Fe(II) oxygenase [Woodsholea maritima]|uniref:2OG-Fe(II) oxygenase n=1 Tax=Woodsholea maritima TaxID=240237 RepID=UPI0014615057|nr:2OG-Fe(II) oxygenase family protein [Woodsholea maritima]